MNKKLLIFGALALVGYFGASNLASIPGLSQAQYLGRNLGLGNGFSTTPV